MVSKKGRRRSGWRTPRISSKEMKFSEMSANAELPLPMYDDWCNYRDGMRDWPGLEQKRKERENR